MFIEKYTKENPEEAEATPGSVLSLGEDSMDEKEVYDLFDIAVRVAVMNYKMGRHDSEGTCENTVSDSYLEWTCRTELKRAIEFYQSKGRLPEYSTKESGSPSLEGVYLPIDDS